MEEKTRLFEAFIDGTKKIPSNKRGAKGTLEYAAIESVRECTNARNRQNKILEDATFNLEAKVHKYGLLENKVLLVRLDDEDDFPSVLNGLVAMRLAAKFKKPTIVARLNAEGYVRGSARAVSNSPLPNLKSFFTNSGYFEYAMGHEGAHGISILNKNLGDFHSWANQELADVDFGEGTFDVNFVRAAADKDIENIIYDLGEYEDTWGQNNPETLMYIHDLNITRDDWQAIGKDKSTLKITKFGICYMKFHAKDLIAELESMDEIKINLIGKPNVNEWNSIRTPQIFIEAYELEDNKFGF
jgi:single-stranded-DNA-specific exonuclease